MRIADSVSAYSSFSGSSARIAQNAPPFSRTLAAQSPVGAAWQRPPSLSSSMWVPKDGSPPTPREDSAVVSQFLGFSTMTFAQWIRDLILKRLNLTEETLASLPLSEREAVEREIVEAVEQALMGKSNQKKLEEAAGDAQQPVGTISKSSVDTLSLRSTESYRFRPSEQS